MKSIICFASGEIEVFSISTKWVGCACGNVRAKWVDPLAGTAVVAAKDEASVRLLGMNNRYLVGHLERRGQDWLHSRELHDQSTNAPNYVFDKSMAGCWAVIAKIASTNDVRWAEPNEWDEAFGLPPAKTEKGGGG